MLSTQHNSSLLTNETLDVAPKSDAKSAKSLPATVEHCPWRNVFRVTTNPNISQLWTGREREGGRDTEANEGSLERKAEKNTGEVA